MNFLTSLISKKLVLLLLLGIFLNTTALYLYLSHKSINTTSTVVVSEISNHVFLNQERQINQKFLSLCSILKVIKMKIVRQDLTYELHCSIVSSIYFTKEVNINSHTFFISIDIYDQVEKFILIVLVFILLTYLVNLLFKIKSVTETQALLKENHAKQIENLTKKVAHDIRSPLSTLNLISSKIDDSEIKNLQLSTVKQINSIAEDILNTDFTNVESRVSANDFFKNIESEYAIKQSVLNRDIKFILSEDLKNIYLSEKLIYDLYPIIINLIQNSIEATAQVNGLISIKIELLAKFLIIQVEDNGEGITEDALVKIDKNEKFSSKSKSPISFSGNGIAIKNANETLKKYQTKLIFSKQPNNGTLVLIKIPL